MTDMMKAAFTVELGQPFEVRSVAIPEPQEGEVLVRMTASGVCPTDVSIAHGKWKMRRPSFPYIAGHEGCGHIAKLGPGVSNLAVGDAVGVFWLNSACGSCDYCSSKRENLCIDQESTGYTVNGTHAEYCVVSADFAVPLPDGDLFAFTPIMCAGVTSYRAVQMLDGRQGDYVVVIGVGGTGHFAIQFAKAAGLNVIAIDTAQEKLDLATELGADFTFLSSKFPVNKVNRMTGGAHGLIVTAAVPEAFAQGMRMLRKGGVCVQVGVGPDELEVEPFQIVINELTVRGSLSGTRKDVIAAVKLVDEGAVRSVFSQTNLDEINDAYADVANGKVEGKLVLRL